jgi:regulator of sirC expression with transglutaminase-like and TPR domain
LKPNSDLVLRDTGLVYEQRKEYDRALEALGRVLNLEADTVHAIADPHSPLLRLDVDAG